MSQQPQQNNKQLAVKYALWRRGILQWILHDVQKQMYDKFYSSKYKTQTWLLARRSGKSFLMCVLAIEQCLKKPNSIVKFLSPTKLQVNNNLRPIMKKILEEYHCPQDLMPKIKEKDYIYYFPNGSEIQLAGTDSGHAEKLRGGDADLVLVDEAGSCDGLQNIIKGVLLPTTLVTKGKLVFAGTPPEDADHDFIKIIEEAEMKGTLTKKTIYDNPILTKEMIEETIVEMGGINTTQSRRELLCELIKDENRSVIPEFTPELKKEIIREWARPPFFDSYVGMDIGFLDLTVVIFAYYDFKADKVIIEDELVRSGDSMDLTKFVEDINNKEVALWTNEITNETKRPSLRVSDINYIVLKEINTKSNGMISFIAANKDDNMAAINTLRQMLASKKIIINPRCETLIRHLENVKWDNHQTKVKFARSPENGHYDAVDAIKYLVRHISYSKNPYPKQYDLNLRSGDSYQRNNPKSIFAAENKPQVEIYKKIFNRR